MRWGPDVVLALACLAAGCGAGERSKVVAHHQIVVTIEETYSDPIDWAKVDEPLGGKVYERSTVTFGDAKVPLFGFKPGVDGIYRDTGSSTNPARWDDLLTLGVGERHACFVFILRSGGRTWLAKWLCDQGTCTAYVLEPWEVLRCFHRQVQPEHTDCSQLHFLPAGPGKVYVDSRVYDDLRRFGVQLPPRYVSLEDPPPMPRDGGRR